MSLKNCIESFEQENKVLIKNIYIDRSDLGYVKNVLLLTEDSEGYLDTYNFK